MRLKGAMRLFNDPNLEQSQKFQPPDIVSCSLEFHNSKSQFLISVSYFAALMFYAFLLPRGYRYDVAHTSPLSQSPTLTSASTHHVNYCPPHAPDANVHIHRNYPNP